jgi:hypothetical protein
MISSYQKIERKFLIGLLCHSFRQIHVVLLVLAVEERCDVMRAIGIASK